MYQTEEQAKEIVSKVREAVKDLGLAAALADGSEGVCTAIELMSEYMMADDQESHDAADKALIEILMGRTGGIRRMWDLG
jgi:hypothetical protein